jgi:glyoxylase-like metal-dependent hydrolase (beta-lactamase superfamily II)
MAPQALIVSLMVGPLATNCYIVADPVTKEACLIDPGAEAGRIMKELKKEGLDLKFIIITHGHGDHIGANSGFKVPIYIHRLDADCLTDPGLNLSRMFMFGITSPKADRLLEEGDEVKLGGLALGIIHTPGHSPGSISIRVGAAVFTGDALFAGSIGRTDLPDGDDAALTRSITEKLFVLPDDTKVYPGHGPASTIGREKRENPFFN